MVLPVGIDILDWAASLIIDFPSSNVPLLYNRNEWRQWGNHLIQLNTFDNNQMPDTADFADWQTWAQAVYYTLNNT